MAAAVSAAKTSCPFGARTPHNPVTVRLLGPYWEHDLSRGDWQILDRTIACLVSRLYSSAWCARGGAAVPGKQMVVTPLRGAKFGPTDPTRPDVQPTCRAMGRSGKGTVRGRVGQWSGASANGAAKMVRDSY